MKLVGSALANARTALSGLQSDVDDRRLLAGDGAPAVLSVGECRLLLAGRAVGRLAYIARQGRPDIVPVNYVLDGKDVLFRSGPGPKLQAADRGDTVAFEVDDLDEDGRSGWSVVVVGRLRRLSTAEAGSLARSPEPWAAGPRRSVVRLEESRTTGRRLG